MEPIWKSAALGSSAADGAVLDEAVDPVEHRRKGRKVLARALVVGLVDARCQGHQRGGRERCETRRDAQQRPLDERRHRRPVPRDRGVGQPPWDGLVHLVPPALGLLHRGALLRVRGEQPGLGNHRVQAAGELCEWSGPGCHPRSARRARSAQGSSGRAGRACTPPSAGPPASRGCPCGPASPTRRAPGASPGSRRPWRSRRDPSGPAARCAILACMQATAAPAKASTSDDLTLSLASVMRHLLVTTGRDFFQEVERLGTVALADQDPSADVRSRARHARRGGGGPGPLAPRREPRGRGLAQARPGQARGVQLGPARQARVPDRQGPPHRGEPRGAARSRGSGDSWTSSSRTSATRSRDGLGPSPAAA